MSASVWQTTRFRIDLSRTKVMGIVNVTPDSFSDGGLHASTRLAIRHCEELLAQGAELLDIGGESTRPGAAPLPADEERRRVLPVLEAALGMGIPVSIDTRRVPVMREALEMGVDIVNDVTALREAGAAELIAGHANCGVCLMHMRGDPASMQLRPEYTDVVAEVSSFLQESAGRLTALGVSAERITLDPGIGFGKTVEHNFELLRRQHELLRLGFPLLVGWSRKSSLGAVTGRPVNERLSASVAAALAASERGARIVRVHDVAATVDALKVWKAAGF